MASVSDSSLALEKCYWRDVREQVTALNPEFASLVDEINPSDEYYFYRTKYPYGSEILKRGAFFLPKKNGELTPFLGPDVPEEIRHDLGYNLNTNPVTIPLNKSLELFVSIDQQLIPFTLVQPGNILGLSRILDLSKQKHSSHAAMSIWDMTAGARSVFMLPKVSDTASHNRLKKAFLLQQEKPFSLLDHWHVFRELASKADQNDQWEAEMLFMSGSWFEALESNDWLKLRCHLLVSNRRGHEFWHNAFSWNLIFSHIHQSHNIKASPHIIDTVKHLFTIATGNAPAFEVATHDQLAPISFLEEVYLNDYGLKNYAPIIMQPCLFTASKKTSVYYSLQLPTSLEFLRKASDGTSTINDLYEVRGVLEQYKESLNLDNLNLQETPITHAASKVEYRYFHTNTTNYPNIEETETIADYDGRFKETLERFPKGNQDFPKNSSFLRGSIQLTNTEDAD